MELFFLIMLVGLMAFALGTGYPVAFALPGAAIITVALAAASGFLIAGDSAAYFASGDAVQWLSAGVTNFRGVYWEVERDTLIAIPLFIFMGIMLQRSKVAEDLLVTMAQLFGPIPGGLGISVIFVGALLAATTGIVGATVVAMGLISLPAMLQHNYSKPLATGTIAASGTLGQIIPPSIVLIILADQLASAVDQAGTARKELYKLATGEISMPSEYGVVSTSAGDMFLGAMVPGVMLVAIYMAFVLGAALLRPRLAPAVPYDGDYDSRFIGKVLLTLIPPLTLIFLVLGSIIAGVATVNQAGAIGAAGALVMAGYRLWDGRRGVFLPSILAVISVIGIFIVTSNFDTNIKDISSEDDELGVLLALISVGGLIVALIWSAWRALVVEDTLRGVMIETAKTTSLVFIILIGAAMLTSAFRAFGGEELVKEFLGSLPGGFWTKFVIVMLVIFVLGFFLDFIEIAVVVVPIVAPILLSDPSANVTAVWLGVMIGLNIQTSFLTPPFGFALFYLRGVAPATVKTTEMYKGVIAFITLQLIALAIVGLNPQLVNYLPNRVSLTAETAPPPLNPGLQYCMENYIFEQFAENGGTIKTAIDRARGLDYSMLPKKLKHDLDDGFEDASKSFGLMEEIRLAEAAVLDASVGYRPLHDEVRHIQKELREIDSQAKAIELDLRRLRDNPDVKTQLEAKLAELDAQRAEIEATIPAEWADADAAFQELTKAERNTRTLYRRTVDAAYGPLADMRVLLSDAQRLGELRPELDAVAAEYVGLDNEAAMERIKLAESVVGSVAGTREIRKALSKARRALRKTSPKPEVAAREMQNALDTYEEELAWRTKAAAELSAPLTEYEAAIANTIGLRGQSRLPEEQALYVAACSATPRNVSLSF